GSKLSTQDLVNSEIRKSLDIAAQTTSITVQATLDGSPWQGPVRYQIKGPSTESGDKVGFTFYGMPLGNYRIAYQGGGPSAIPVSIPEEQSLGVNHNTGSNTWNLTFTLAFASATPNLPSVQTGNPSSIAGD